MSLAAPAVVRVLVLDPDDVNCRLLCALFNEAGREVTVVASAAALLGAAIDEGADAVLMEVDCGGVDGFEVCAQLRARGYRGPVVFVTSRHEMRDKLRAFQCGADDYVVKPFDGRELQARVTAVSRRVLQAQHLALGRDISVGDATLSPGSGTFRLGGGRPAYLSPTEVRLLECLMRDCGVTISRDALLERAWPQAFVGDASRVDVVVARLRRKIERDPAAPEYIHTVRGFGYTFRPLPRPVLAGQQDLPAAFTVSLPGA